MKFFGESAPQPSPKKPFAAPIMIPADLTRRSRRSKPVQGDSKLSAFFGERPPDELIVDRLQDFFPNLADGDVRYIAQANLTFRRESKQYSMLSRRTIIVSQHGSTPSYASSGPKSSTPQQPKSLQSVAESSEIRSPLPRDSRMENSIARWERGRMIGQGGFGKVFHALNLDTGQVMAVKQVPIGERSAVNTKQIDALKREIELLKDLNMENVVQYLGTPLQD